MNVLLCQCNELNELKGIEAQRYEKEHLIEVSTNPDTWETIFKCPDTEILWVADLPFGEGHGGGPERLRKITK